MFAIIDSLLNLFGTMAVESFKLYYLLDGLQTEIICKMIGIPSIVLTMVGIIIWIIKKL